MQFTTRKNLVYLSILVCSLLFATLIELSTVDGVQASRSELAPEVVDVVSVKSFQAQVPAISRILSKVEDVFRSSSLLDDGEASNQHGDQADNVKVLISQVGEIGSEFTNEAKDSRDLRGIQSSKLDQHLSQAGSEANVTLKVSNDFVVEVPVLTNSGESLDPAEAKESEIAAELDAILREWHDDDLPDQVNTSLSTDAGDVGEVTRLVLLQDVTTPAPITPASSTSSSSSGKTTIVALAIAVPITVAVTIAVGLCCILIYRHSRIRKNANLESNDGQERRKKKEEKDDSPLLNTAWPSRSGEGKKGDAIVLSGDAMHQSKKGIPVAGRQPGTVGFLNLAPAESMRRLRGTENEFFDAVDHSFPLPDDMSGPTLVTTYSTSQSKVSLDVRVSVESTTSGSLRGPPKRPPPPPLPQDSGMAVLPPTSPLPPRIPLPLPPGRAAAKPPPPPPPPPPGSMKGPPPPPAPPGPKKGGPLPPPPPVGKFGGVPTPSPAKGLSKPPASSGGSGLAPLRVPPLGESFSPKSTPSRVSRTGSGRKDSPVVVEQEPVDSKKLKPLHWDKVKPRKESVWNDLLNGSFELDTLQMETLFEYLPSIQPHINNNTRASPAMEVSKTLIEPRKANNISIQLRGLGFTTDEICEALLEGDESLPTEVLEKLSKMSLTDDEVWKIREFKGKRSGLGPAEKFLINLLEIPHAFQRINTMLFRANCKDDLAQLQEAIADLEMACVELKGSRTFVKLLEAVLKAGNRLNTGTFRGDAQAFKLETLLKLADIKGTDGKISLLHFVIQEIVRAEGARASKLASEDSPRSPPSNSSTPTEASRAGLVGALYRNQEEATKDSNSKFEENSSSKHLGLKLVTDLSSGLTYVKRAAVLDIEALSSSIKRLSDGLKTCKKGLRKYFKSSDGRGLLSIDSSEESDNIELSNDTFSDAIMSFVRKAETDVEKVQKELDVALGSVKSVSIYFSGEVKKDDPPLRVFQVVKDFLVILERVCREVGNQVQNHNRRPSLSMPFPPTLRG